MDFKVNKHNQSNFSGNQQGVAGPLQSMQKASKNLPRLLFPDVDGWEILSPRKEL